MSSWSELIPAYLRERYRSRVFVPLALVLATTGMVAGGARFDSPAIGLQTLIACYLLVLAFRVWDDLEDRERDQRDHPDRVLVRSGVNAPWLALLATALVSGTVLASLGPNAGQRLAILGGWILVLFVWYRTRRALAAHPLIGTSIVFAKYPLIAFVTAPPSHAPPLALSVTVLLALYFALCIYELADDATLRGSIP